MEVQYYVNDMGRQIAVVSWACERFELDLSRKSDSAIADVYIKANVELDKNPEYVKEIDALMEKVEAGDARTIDSFYKAVSLAISGIKETLLRLNVAHVVQDIVKVVVIDKFEVVLCVYFRICSPCKVFVFYKAALHIF